MSNTEFLNKARKMLTDDYKTQHTAEYNAWMAAHQNSWMQPHIVVPFPPFIVSSALAPFKAVVSAPSEEDIVAKALELYQQANPAPLRKEVIEDLEPEVTLNQPLNQPLDIAPTVAVPEVIVPTVVETVESAPALIDKLLETPAIKPVSKELPESIPESIPEPVSKELPESIPEPVSKELPEPVSVEPVSVEPVAEEKVKPYVDEIYKIYQPTDPETVDPLGRFTVFTAMEQALKVVPQPNEELAKVTKSGKILPSMMDKLQSITSKWSTKGEKNV